MTVDDAPIRRAIVGAFPTKPRPRADEITRPGDDYWERRELRTALKHRAWTTLPRDLIWRRRADLIWLAPRGFGYFIAAWMLRGLEDPEIRDYVFSALADYPSWLPEGDATDGLTAAQIAAVIEFLRWVAATDPTDATRVTTAIERYWHPRLSR